MVSTRDHDESVRFYTEAFGLRLAGRLVVHSPVACGYLARGRHRMHALQDDHVRL
jgi:catechol 2,3-dioxygenase-like lactoylglutathione lyase family enzyme